jgi:beta-fructofuranosidase
MLYTGIGRADGGLVQRIGLAVSDDLIRWEKHPMNPVLRADPRWYDLLDRTRWRDESWRDPWLFREDGDVFFHVLITARSREGAPDAAGVVAHAQSLDLVEWEVLPPLTRPGEFAQVEAPQLVRMNGRYQILVSCLAEDHSRDRVERLGAGLTGTFVYTSGELLGPYRYDHGPVVQDSPLGTLYAGKLVEVDAEQWRFMAFRGDGDREFLGEITDPLPLRDETDGSTVVAFV